MKINRANIESVRAETLQAEDGDILVRVLDSFNLWLPVEDASLTPCLVRDGYWEAWITTWFYNNLNIGDNVIDIGANVGYYSLLAKRIVGPVGQVIAFEPAARHASLIKRSAKNNDLNVVVVDAAATDECGYVTLTHPGDFMGSASITTGTFAPEYGEVTTEVVKGVRIDDFGLNGVDLIKIDAEGAEEKVWAGMRSTLHNDKPIVVLEYTPLSYSESFMSELMEYGNITEIDFAGDEVPVNLDALDEGDWKMLVVRPSK